MTGNKNKYVGCKLERNWKEGWIRITQPVLLQSYKDEFDLPESNVATPANPGQILVPCKEEHALNADAQTAYRLGVAKMLHMMRWSRPELLNLVRELSCFMKMAAGAHIRAMYQVMQYCVNTPKHGLLLKPKGKWNGAKDKEFEVMGKSDANYASTLR